MLWPFSYSCWKHTTKPPPATTTTENRPPPSLIDNKEEARGETGDDVFLRLEREIRMLGDEILASKRVVRHYSARLAELLNLAKTQAMANAGVDEARHTQMMIRAFRISLATQWQCIRGNRAKIAALEDRQITAYPSK